MEKVASLNVEDPTATYGVTKFADMTEEEFMQYPCGGVLSKKQARSTRIVGLPPVSTPATSAAPDNFDWTTQGAVTPVKDQGQCGSCWAFSTIGNIEGAWFLAGNPLTSLAESELVDCSTTDYGCSGGWPFWALTDVLASPYNGRIATEASYPYVASDRSCQFKTATYGAKISNYTNYCNEETAPCTEDQIQTLLQSKGPLSVCLNANPMQLYSSGVSNPAKCDPNGIDHCVTLVGWGIDATTNQKYWKLKNSWGTSWGEKGYYRLIRGVADKNGACGINRVITAVAI
jgi:C1A family cysteine protease